MKSALIFKFVPLVFFVKRINPAKSRHFFGIVNQAFLAIFIEILALIFYAAEFYLAAAAMVAFPFSFCQRINYIFFFKYIIEPSSYYFINLGNYHLFLC